MYENPLFQREIITKQILWYQTNAQNWTENKPVIIMLCYHHSSGWMLFVTLALFDHNCVGLDEDLTNAVTKHAIVSLWWHWSTGLVNRNVFRTWLMCFLLTPVTHVCGGCLRSGNQSGLDAQLVSKCKIKKLFFANDKWKITRWTMWFYSWVCFCGRLPTCWCQNKGLVQEAACALTAETEK